MTNPFAFDKFKDITTAFTVQLHDDGVILDPGFVGPLPYSHPTVLHLLNSINTGSLPVELFLTLLEQSVLTQQQLFYDGCVVVGVVEWRDGMTLTIGNLASGGNTSRQINGQWTRRAISSKRGLYVMTYHIYYIYYIISYLNRYTSLFIYNLTNFNHPRIP